MQRIFIEPLDVLMFRNERPFTATETHVAKMGIISPRTFEGAIKSKLLAKICETKNLSLDRFQSRTKVSKKTSHLKETSHEQEETIQDSELIKVLQIIGHPFVKPSDSSAVLRVTNVCFAEKKENNPIQEYFPLPNDVVTVDGTGNDNTYEMLEPKPFLIQSSSNASESQHDLFLLMPGSTLQPKSANKLMPFQLLKKYLNGTLNPSDLHSNHSLLKNTPYVIEERNGIKIDATKKRVAEGALYVAEFLRLKKNWGFTIWFSFSESTTESKTTLSLDFSNDIIRLGGEGRAATVYSLEAAELNTLLDSSKVIEKINNARLLKLYLVTPAYFGGSLPPKELLETKLGIKLKLIGALPGKPVYVGGFDMARNQEKPLRRWVAPGAVYFYCLKSDSELSLDADIFLSIINEKVEMRGAFLAAPSRNNMIKEIFRGEKTCTKKV